MACQRQICLELLRREIVQRRVKSLAVVDVFDEAADGGAGVGEIAVGAGIDLLRLDN